MSCTSPGARRTSGCRRRLDPVLLLSLLAFAAACSGSDGAQGPPGAPAPIEPTRATPLPGFNLTILSVQGGTGTGGNFKAGDRPVIRFTATEGQQGSPNTGNPIPSTKWAFQEALFSGPTSNFQRILNTSAIAANSVHNSDGSWTFTWPDPIPATVPAQINQENTIPYDSGTLAGQPLPSGTYTIGMSLRQDITIEGTTFRDSTSTTFDVLLGSATQLTRRELVTDNNCQRCHTTLRAHGENRYGVKYCVLCHANGAEDLNDPNAAAGPTLGLSISFQTMIHKIHSGRHLPSVNGKTVDANGNPVYGPGHPYVIVRSRGEFDFSEVGFPQWPHLSQGMPRDIGYGALGSAQRTVENMILGGPTNCQACHGDPDGSGPLPAPANGDAIFSAAIVTRACIACHDDWDPSKPYTSNGQTMPAGLPDSACTDCHGESPSNPNSAVNVRKAHTHPLLDTSTPPLWGAGAGAIGLHFNVTGVDEAQGDGDGLIEVGEKIQVSLDIVDGQGAAVAPGAIKRMEIVANGPVANPNLIYVTSFTAGSASSPPPTSVLTGSGPSYSFLLPERVELEVASELSATEFQTARTPHHNSQFGTTGQTLVWTVPTGVGGGTTTTAPVQPYQNYIDVVDASGIAANDYIVVDEASADREYLKVKAVQGNRLWFLAPIDVAAIALRKAHPAGTAVVEVTPAPESTFTLDEANGTITFAAAPTGRVLVSYTTDFVVPPKYRGAINNSPSIDPNAPALDASIGDWAGLDLVSGTYRIGIFGEVGFDVTVSGASQTQVTSYTEGAEGDTVKGFRIGTDGPIEASGRISDAANCYACHRDLQFHGAHRRGFNNCLLCHGSAGSEDWPVFKTAGLNSPETPGVTIEFRNMLHKIHRGRDLAEGSSYQIIGFNGSANTFEEIGFPTFKGGVANCDVCHGSGNTAWFEPTDRLHPSASIYAPQANWRLVCGSCHDDRTAAAHIGANTSGGLEACLICHGPGKQLPVEIVHKHFVR